jgi:RimJ/RimL family protein N-acetyltransferase
LGTAWVPAPGAADALAQLVASGYGVAVVSNTEHGEIADVLARTNVCSVNGEGTNIAAVIDSNVIGVAKPDPRPFELAFAALNESASTCIHIGDSLHSDVVGARGVGMEVVHVDPIALCADSDHRHAASFAAFVSELLAEVTGDQIVNQEEPRSYSDGVVTIRRLQTSDLEMDLEAKDDEQITWLWEPGQRENWEAMTGDQQRAHAIRHLQSVHDGFGEGSKWCFAVDTLDVKYVAYIDFDLANNHVPLGEANIAYSSHPSYRGRGYVSRAVRLIFQFLEENTNAERAHILVDVRNVASHRVAMSVGGVAVGDLPNDHGGIMTRYIVELKNNKS